MEEKIYERQVTKQSLSFRVVDQQQIERHFTMNELAELYTFEPDTLDDPLEKKSKRATPKLPKVPLVVKICLDSRPRIILETTVGIGSTYMQALMNHGLRFDGLFQKICRRTG